MPCGSNSWLVCAHLEAAEVIGCLYLLQRLVWQQVHQIVALCNLHDSVMQHQIASWGRRGEGVGRLSQATAPLSVRLDIWGEDGAEASWHSAATTQAYLQHHARLQAALDVDVKLRFGQSLDKGFSSAGVHATEHRHRSYAVSGLMSAD